MHKPLTPKPPTPEDPCIRRCTLDESDVCLGCARPLHDILHWHTYDAQQRQTLFTAHQQALLQKTQKMREHLVPTTPLGDSPFKS